MLVYYDIVKLIFFVLTFIVALYELRLKGVLPHSIVDVIWPFVMPFYLILVGLIIGYIIGYVLTQKRWVRYEEESYKQGFVIGGIIGLILSGIYYFMLG